MKCISINRFTQKTYPNYTIPESHTMYIALVFKVTKWNWAAPAQIYFIFLTN